MTDHELDSTPQTETLFGVEEMELNFGPQHPATHGVLRLKLRIDGERIVDCYPIVGYLHRGTEKLFELHPFFQNVPHTDRLDYVAAATNNLAYVGAVEKLLGLTVPPRASYIRTLLSELQRISSHLLWLATHAIDIGAMTPFFYTFRERELILDMFEEYCGARLTLNCMRPGGQPFDLPVGWMEKVGEFIDTFPAKVDEYEGLLTENRIWKKRTDRDWCPAARGGPGLRCDRAHVAGQRHPMGHPQGHALRGLRQSGLRCTGLRQLRHLRSLSGADGGDAAVGANRHPVSGEDAGRAHHGQAAPGAQGPKDSDVYFSVEGPKGEIGFYIVGDGSPNPHRCRVRPPSFYNIEVLPEMVRGGLIADLIAVIGTTDIVLGEVDR